MFLNIGTPFHLGFYLFSFHIDLKENQGELNNWYLTSTTTLLDSVVSSQQTHDVFWIYFKNNFIDCFIASLLDGRNTQEIIEIEITKHKQH